MADHLRLPPPTQLSSRRLVTAVPSRRPLNRAGHGADLSVRLSEIRVDVGDTDDSDNALPVVLKMTASTRLAPGPLNGLHLENLGEGNGWSYYVLSNRESRQLLADLLAAYRGLSDDEAIDWDRPKTWAYLLDSINGLELYGPEDRADSTIADLDFGRTAVVDCLIWPSGTAEGAERRLAIVTGLLEEDDDSLILAQDQRVERTLVRARVTRRTLDRLLNEAVIERIRGPLRSLFTETDLRDFLPDADPRQEGTTAIGIADGVINVSNGLTGPYVVASKDFPESHVFGSAGAHGTAVAGGAIWGDLDGLLAGQAGRVPHPVVSARILDGDEVPNTPHLVIESAIRWMVDDHQVKIVNLSLNRESPASREPLRDELTYTLDILARELKIVIVVSAGNRTANNSHWLNDYPTYLGDEEQGIAAPGDSAIAVTVGSYAKRDRPEHSATGDLPIAAAGQASPFTLVGPSRSPGRKGTLKPEFAEHGGNWTWDSSQQFVDEQDAGTAAIVAVPPHLGRVVGANWGTSFAAPLVAHEIARIADRYPEAGANLLRALCALSARPPIGTAMPNLEGRRWHGYGIPEAARVLESSPSRTILMREDTVLADTSAVYQLPIPPEFADGSYVRSFRVALAFDPPVRRQRREYVAGRMTVDLVRGISTEQVEEIYRRQPTRAQAEVDESLTRYDLPDQDHRPMLDPGTQTVNWSTLIRRDFVNGRWDPDHEGYFLVVSHLRSPCSERQKKEYTEQGYAVAVEVAHEGRTDLDLYAMMRARLAARLRVRRR